MDLQPGEGQNSSHRPSLGVSPPPPVQGVTNRRAPSVISEYLFIIFIFSPHLSPGVQNTPPYLGPCVRSSREPGARPCCPVTRGSKCVFWVLSGTKPQYLPRGRTHVLTDAGKVERSWCVGSLFGRVPVCFSTVLFQEGVHGRGPADRLCCPTLLTTPPSPTWALEVECGGPGEVMGAFSANQVQNGDTRHCPVVWTGHRGWIGKVTVFAGGGRYGGWLGTSQGRGMHKGQR